MSDVLRVRPDSFVAPERSTSAAEALASEGALHMTEIIALELLYLAQRPADYEKRWEGLSVLPWLPMTAEVSSEALRMQRLFGQKGLHRRPIPDLLVAAVALVHGATVLHDDRDFDLISEACDLSARWISPAGTGHGGGP